MSALLPALNRIADAIDSINRRIGHAVSWLALSMAIVTFSVATLRYGFSVGWVWFQETYVWMHGTIIMVAMAYTLMTGGHVRVDIIYRTASVRYKALVDILGTLFLLLPTLYVIGIYTIPYVLLSWERLEVSREAGGMPGLFLFKTTMLLFFTLLFLQAVAILIRSSQALISGQSIAQSEENFDEVSGG